VGSKEKREKTPLKHAWKKKNHSIRGKKEQAPRRKSYRRGGGEEKPDPAKNEKNEGGDHP